MDIVLRYIGDRDSQQHYVMLVPRSDLTSEQIVDIARARGMEPDETIAWLISTGAYEDATTPVPESEPVTQEG